MMVNDSAQALKVKKKLILRYYVFLKCLNFVDPIIRYILEDGQKTSFLDVLIERCPD